MSPTSSSSKASLSVLSVVGSTESIAAGLLSSYSAFGVSDCSQESSPREPCGRVEDADDDTTVFLHKIITDFYDRVVSRKVTDSLYGSIKELVDDWLKLLRHLHLHFSHIATVVEDWNGFLSGVTNSTRALALDLDAKNAAQHNHLTQELYACKENLQAIQRSLAADRNARLRVEAQLRDADRKATIQKDQHERYVKVQDLAHQNAIWVLKENWTAASKTATNTIQQLTDQLPTNEKNETVDASHSVPPGKMSGAPSRTRSQSLSPRRRRRFGFGLPCGSAAAVKPVPAISTPHATSSDKNNAKDFADNTISKETEHVEQILREKNEPTKSYEELFAAHERALMLMQREFGELLCEAHQQYEEKEQDDKIKYETRLAELMEETKARERANAETERHLNKLNQRLEQTEERLELSQKETRLATDHAAALLQHCRGLFRLMDKMLQGGTLRQSDAGLLNELRKALTAAPLVPPAMSAEASNVPSRRRSSVSSPSLNYSTRSQFSQHPRPPNWPDETRRPRKAPEKKSESKDTCSSVATNTKRTNSTTEKVKRSIGDSGWCDDYPNKTDTAPSSNYLKSSSEPFLPFSTFPDDFYDGEDITTRTSSVAVDTADDAPERTASQAATTSAYCVRGTATQRHPLIAGSNNTLASLSSYLARQRHHEGKAENPLQPPISELRRHSQDSIQTETSNNDDCSLVRTRGNVVLSDDLDGHERLYSRISAAAAAAASTTAAATTTSAVSTKPHGGAALGETQTAYFRSSERSSRASRSSSNCGRMDARGNVDASGRGLTKDFVPFNSIHDRRVENETVGKESFFSPKFPVLTMSSYPPLPFPRPYGSVADSSYSRISSAAAAAAAAGIPTIAAATTTSAVSTKPHGSAVLGEPQTAYSRSSSSSKRSSRASRSSSNCGRMDARGNAGGSGSGLPKGFVPFISIHNRHVEKETVSSAKLPGTKTDDPPVPFPRPNDSVADSSSKLSLVEYVQNSSSRRRRRRQQHVGTQDNDRRSQIDTSQAPDRSKTTRTSTLENWKKRYGKTRQEGSFRSSQTANAREVDRSSKGNDATSTVSAVGTRYEGRLSGDKSTSSVPRSFSNREVVSQGQQVVSCRKPQHIMPLATEPRPPSNPLLGRWSSKANYSKGNNHMEWDDKVRKTSFSRSSPFDQQTGYEGDNPTKPLKQDRRGSADTASTAACSTAVWPRNAVGGSGSSSSGSNGHPMVFGDQMSAGTARTYLQLHDSLRISNGGACPFPAPPPGSSRRRGRDH